MKKIGTVTRDFYDRIIEQLRARLSLSILEQSSMVLASVLLGVVGALSAQFFLLLLRWAQSIFLKGIAGYTPLGLVSEGGSATEIIGSHGLWLIPVATTVGGLIAGILIYSLAPEAEGHGTDTAVKAFHEAGGFIRARVPFVKLIASAITLGSGGAAGREGPTALISAGIGSIYGVFARYPQAQRRTLVLIGEAAGLSAIFRSPIGTAVFVTEVLYGNMEFEASALIYTMISSVVAYIINGAFVGWTPLFQISITMSPPGISSYLRYALLGVAAGIIATIFPMVFYTVRDAFRALKIPPHVKPAIGGLIVGLMALVVPGVLGGGYGWIQAAIDDQLSTATLLMLTFGMIIALPMTVSSGGSGGVFAPSLFVGAMLGGLLGHVLHQPVTPFVIVGMASVFAGAARVPIAAMLMVTEMTGGYHLLAAAALAVMLSNFVQVNLSLRLKYKSLYEAQVAYRSESPAHHEEQIDAVMKLLSTDGYSVPHSVNHVDLRRLLLTGMPVDLPDDRQMVLLTIQDRSPCVGQTVMCLLSFDESDQVEVIAAFRKGHTLFPHSEKSLQAGDKLLAIVSPKGREELTEYISTF
jgi:CIC family chloride channel protein